MRDFAFYLVVALSVSAPARADDSPQAIIDKAIKALGGKDKLNAIKALQVKTKGTLNLKGTLIPIEQETLIDLGGRFRLLVNEVTAVDHPPLPKLPVARAVWECKPDFKTACAAWILAGGAHHTGFSYSVTTEMLEDFATIADIELVRIGDGVTLSGLKQDLRSNDVYYYLAQGFRA